MLDGAELHTLFSRCLGLSEQRALCLAGTHPCRQMSLDFPEV